MDCPECDRLWRTYAFATRQHLDIIREHEEAIRSDDMERLRSVEEALRGAEEWRTLARKAVLEHDALHRKEKSGAGDSPGLFYKTTLI